MTKCNCLNHPTLELDELHDTCDCGDPDWPKVANLHFDEPQRLVLDLVRCAAGGFATRDLRLWDFGLSAAMNKLGPVEGAGLFAGSLAVVKTIRVERSGIFEFLTVRCCRITNDERDLMSCLTFARTRNGMALEQGVMRLVRSHDCAGTITALSALGAHRSLARASDKETAPPLSAQTGVERTLH